MSDQAQEIVTHCIALILVALMAFWTYRAIAKTMNKEGRICAGCQGKCGGDHTSQSAQSVRLTIGKT